MTHAQFIQMYLDEALSGDENPSLAASSEGMLQVYHRPPGIHTLSQWGLLKMNTGKHKGKTFDQIFSVDPAYAQRLQNRRDLVATDLLSFQNYTKARVKKEHEAEGRMSVCPFMQDVEWKPNSQRPIPPRGSKMPNRDEWEMIQHQIGYQGKGESSKAVKRTWKEPSQAQAMDQEVDSQRIQQLQTQVTILQRELARMMPAAETAREDDNNHQQ